MHLKHIKHMIRRRQQHVFPFCQDHCLKHVDGLRDIGHLYAVCVLMKNVKMRGCDKGVADRILLIQKARIRAWLRIKPRAPFINDQPDSFSGSY